VVPQGRGLPRQEKLKQAHTCYRRALSLEPENPTLLMSYALSACT